MEWTPRPLVEHLREQERHNVTVITVGSKYEVYVRSPASSHMQTLKQPFQTLAIKWEVNIFLKKSSCVLHSCVFLPVSFILASVIIASVCIQYIYVCNNVLQKSISFHNLITQPILVQTYNFQLFLHMLLMRSFGRELVKLLDYETISIFLKHPAYFKLHQFIGNTK